MPGENGIIGSILDERYQIESKLGEGGMGAVYLARNLQIGKPVAIKVLHGGLVADERVEARFTQEISVMSSLSHPNLITIQDAGIIPSSGIPYFVMEYLEARSLDHILKENGPLGIEQVQAVLYQVADALAHAHKKGVVHRDLKPANVLLLKSEGQYFVKVVDLGIAKAIRPDGAAAELELTRTGEVFGSPQYMSPEQCNGEPQDRRTDIYAFGCLIYAVLTGKPPFVRRTAIETIVSQVNDEPPPFSQYETLAGQPLALALEPIACRCLAKDPAERYADMGEVMTELKRAASGTVSAVPVHRVEKVSETPKENSGGNKALLVVSGIAILLLGTLLGLGSQILIKPHSQPQAQPASSPPPQITQMPDWKDQVKAALNNMNHPVANISLGPHPEDAHIVRVLSIYHGKPTADYTDVIKGQVDVDIKPPLSEDSDKDLILVLSAYMPTTWKLHLSSPAVRLKQVVSVGFFPQTVTGMPEGVVLTEIYSPALADKLGAGSKGERHVNPFDPWMFLYTGGANLSGGDLAAEIQADPLFEQVQKDLLKFSGSHLRSFVGTRATDHFIVK